jgi:RTX calcium-binding nonapeptide repeat (4 copies)
VTSLSGAEGSDRLRGGDDDDLLIAGATAHDNNIPALLQILAEWTSAHSYATRVANLRSGVGGLPKLDSTTVIDDGVVDTLRGNKGLDWFFAGPNDRLRDRQPTEEMN